MKRIPYEALSGETVWIVIDEYPNDAPWGRDIVFSARARRKTRTGSTLLQEGRYTEREAHSAIVEQIENTPL